MITQVANMFKNVVKLTDEQKKDKLVDLRVSQLVREQLLGEDAPIPPGEEFEGMAILQTMFRLDDIDTIEKMITLREEINTLAQAKLLALKTE